MKNQELPVYENETHHVYKFEHGYQVFKVGITHSTKCATIGYKGQIGLEKAIVEADRRNK